MTERCFVLRSFDKLRHQTSIGSVNLAGYLSAYYKQSNKIVMTLRKLASIVDSSVW